MNIKAEKSECMQAVADGNQKQALDNLLSLLRNWADRTNRTDARVFLKQCMLLSGRWNDLRKKVDMGVMAVADEKIEANKITHALLNLLEELPDDLDMTGEARSPTGNRRTILFTGMILLISILGILFYTQFYGREAATPGDSGEPSGLPPAALDSLPDSTKVGADSINKIDAIIAERESVDLWQLKYQLPDPLPIDWNLADNMCSTTYGCLPAQFLPIGWSANERFFAYVTLPAKEAVEGITLIIRIHNMEDNTTAWKYTYGAGESSRRNKYKSLSAIWDGFYELFSGQLRNRGIIPGAGSVVIFPGKINGEEIAVQIVKETKKNGLGHELIHQEQVRISLSDRSPETIYTHTYAEFGPLNTAVIGALVSPSSRTVALIKVNERPGYEGPPNPLYPTVIGWQLRK